MSFFKIKIMAELPVTFGGPSARPSVSPFDSLISFFKVSNIGDEALDQNAPNSKKLTKHLKRLAERDLTYVVAAFELLSKRPDLAYMLGGISIPNVMKVAEWLKNDTNRLFSEDIVRGTTRNIMKEIGPLGIGKTIGIQGDDVLDEIYGGNTSSYATGSDLFKGFVGASGKLSNNESG